MAYISSVGINNNWTCLMLENADNALNIVKTILFDEQYANDKTGQYAIMISLEENLFRLDILDTFADDPVIFGSADQVEQKMRKEILGEENEEID